MSTVRPSLIVFPWVALFSFAIAGCDGRPKTDHRATQPYKDPSPTVSQFKSETPPEKLRRVANDKTMPPEKRYEAIFTLLANHLTLPQDAAGVSAVLGGSTWLEDATLTGVYDLAGAVFFEVTMDETGFFLQLLPNKDGRSEWRIEFVLSGDSRRSADEARRFLQGDNNLNGTPKLMEFVLCFPGNYSKTGLCIERFTEKGLTRLGRPVR